MMKKITSLLLCLILLFLPLTVHASGNFVVDQASLLDDAARQVLEEECAALYEEYGVELVFLTVNSLEGKSAMDYADDYYDNQGYGDDGILFLLAMAEREWYISTAGTAIEALHDQALLEIEYEIVPYLSAGRYDDAFFHLQSILPYYLDQQILDPKTEVYYDAYGERYTVDYDDYAQEDSGVNVLFSLLAGAVIAGLVLMGMRASMNTKRAQRSAVNYQTENSYRLTQHQDLFLYSNVTKRPRPQNNGSHGGRPGGGHHSSIHRSAGGRSHGGRGGRF